MLSTPYQREAARKYYQRHRQEILANFRIAYRKQINSEIEQGLRLPPKQYNYNSDKFFICRACRTKKNGAGCKGCDCFCNA